MPPVSCTLDTSASATHPELNPSFPFSEIVRKTFAKAGFFKTSPALYSFA